MAVVMARAQDYTGWVNHTYEVSATLNRLGTATERVENTRRGYMLTGQPLFRRRYFETSAAIPTLIAKFAVLTADNGPQRHNLVRLRGLLDQQRQTILATIAEIDGGGRDAAIARFGQDEALATVRLIRTQLVAMTEEENRLLTIRSRDQRDSVHRLYWLLGGLGLLVILVVLGSIRVIFGYGENLTRTAAELRRLNDDLEGAVAERTTDLSRANEEIQRFAYIVSHDLRSPLVNVMGFTAELEGAAATLDAFIERVEAEAPAIDGREAALAAREDLPEAIGFIRSSTEKMDRLINAILRLSREGRRTMAPQRLDMAAVIGGIRDSLRHLLDETGGEILIADDLPGIVSDRLAIEQIFSNLIENAIKYRSPKRALEIAVRGHRSAGRLVYEIADNGRGIDPRDHDRVFDLFRRSGTQDQPGEGIGLAHVRALAYRLGGTIACDSALDAGATFRLSFPPTYDAAEDRAK